MLVAKQKAVLDAQIALVGAVAGDYGLWRDLKLYLRLQRDLGTFCPPKDGIPRGPTQLAARTLQTIIKGCNLSLTTSSMAGLQYTNLAECLTSNAPTMAAAFFETMHSARDDDLRFASFDDRIAATIGQCIKRSRELMPMHLLTELRVPSIPQAPPPPRPLGPPAPDALAQPAAAMPRQPVQQPQHPQDNAGDWRRDRRRAASTWNPMDYAMMAESRDNGFREDCLSPFGAFEEERPDLIGKVSQSWIERNPPPLQATPETFYAYMAAFTSALTKLGGAIELEITDTSSASTGSLSARITDRAFEKHIPRQIWTLYEAARRFSRCRFDPLMVRCHIREAFDEDGMASIERGQGLFAWNPEGNGCYKGGFGQTCLQRNHELLVPAYAGMRVHAPIAKKHITSQSGLNKLPLMKAVGWNLANGMMPPPMTSCPTPGCAGYWTDDEASCSRKGQLLIPGWTASLKRSRHAVKAELHECLRTWPPTLITICGLGDRALRNCPSRARNNLTAFWHSANADDLRFGKPARDPATRPKDDEEKRPQ